MSLSDYVTTFGQQLLARHGQKVHKLAINAGLTCPNRDGSKGRGGCTFCNNSSFNPNAKQPPAIAAQIDRGRQVIPKRSGARRYLAYFQAYTNTYDEVARLRTLYESALNEHDIVGLSVGTRPDCVPQAVLDLLAGYRDQGYEVWLELGLQSSFDSSLARVNRGHGFAEYRQALRATHALGLPVCTHLITGLPGEDETHSRITLERVLELGVEGLKLHPLHVVKGTALANTWRAGDYQPWEMQRYIELAVELIEMTPAEVGYHRVTGTAPRQILLAPEWCSLKWAVLNGIEREFVRRGSRQGSALQHRGVAHG